MLFTYELQRRLAASGASTIAVALHPGAVPTDLQRHTTGAFRVVGGLLLRTLGQPDAATGALATLRAATDPAVRGGEYYGPDGWLGRHGHPVRTASSRRSHDADMQRRLWTESPIRSPRFPPPEDPGAPAFCHDTTPFARTIRSR